MNELMQGLLLSSVWMVIVALLGMYLMLIVYVGRPQTIIVWGGWSTEAIRHRKCRVAENGNLEFFGDGELSIPMGLKDQAGEILEFVLVKRQQVMAYV